MRRRVRSSVTLKNVAIEPPAVQVDGEHIAAQLLGPVVSLVNHQPAVCVTAARGVRRTADAFANVAPFLPRVPVHVISSLSHQAIEVTAEVLAVHPLVMRSRQHMPQVSDDSIDEE